ncbi:MAG TPA: hypothetical protein PK746_01270 [Spirochaetales bacterium]|nr:hypothetical protein [Spirochaetales bacterium]
MKLFSTAMAVIGSLIISLGLVLQKRGVAWFRHTNKNSAEYKLLRNIWFIGFVLNNLLSIFYYFALKGLSASVVGAMMGLNIIFSALFSRLILKEHLSKTIITLSLILVFFIALANLTSAEETTTAVPAAFEIYLFFILPFCITTLAQLLKKTAIIKGELYAILFAASAGSLEGFIIILIKALQASKGSNPLLYFSSPYLYFYILASVSLIMFMQVAYSHGRMTRTGPVLWAMQILYPVIISYISFKTQFIPLQTTAFAGIILCVILIQFKKT